MRYQGIVTCVANSLNGLVCNEEPIFLARLYKHSSPLKTNDTYCRFAALLRMVVINQEEELLNDYRIPRGLPTSFIHRNHQPSSIGSLHLILFCPLLCLWDKLKFLSTKISHNLRLKILSLRENAPRKLSRKGSNSAPFKP